MRALSAVFCILPPVLRSKATDAAQIAQRLKLAILCAVSTKQKGAVPAVALTAFAREADRRRALLAGYRAHLAKPVEATQLLATVARLAGRR